MDGIEPFQGPLPKTSRAACKCQPRAARAICTTICSRSLSLSHTPSYYLKVPWYLLPGQSRREPLQTASAVFKERKDTNFEKSRKQINFQDGVRRSPSIDDRLHGSFKGRLRECKRDGYYRRGGDPLAVPGNRLAMHAFASFRLSSVLQPSQEIFTSGLWLDGHSTCASVYHLLACAWNAQEIEKNGIP